MNALIHITQLPEFKARLIRQIETLDVAAGFTPSDKRILKERYNQLLEAINDIMERDEVVLQGGSYNELQPIPNTQHPTPNTQHPAPDNIPVHQPEIVNPQAAI